MHPSLPWFVLLIALSAWACAGPSGPGTNRFQVFPDIPVAKNPVKLLLAEASKKAEQGTFLFSGVPSQSPTYTKPATQVASDILIGAAKTAGELRADAKMREKFLVGEAFEAALERISYKGPDTVPVYQIELVHCLPVGEQL